MKTARPSMKVYRVTYRIRDYDLETSTSTVVASTAARAADALMAKKAMKYYGRIVDVHEMYESVTVAR